MNVSDEQVPQQLVLPPYTEYRVKRYDNEGFPETIIVFAHDAGSLVEGDSQSLAFVEWYIHTAPDGTRFLNQRYVRFVRAWYDVEVIPTPATVN